MAGGSRIVINDEGITISTGGKILYQAQQHKFEGGQKIKAEIPQLPLVNVLERYSHRLDLSNLYSSENFSKVKYYAFKKGNDTSYISGTLDSWGRTERFSSESADEYKLMICDPDDSWEIVMNENEEEK